MAQKNKKNFSVYKKHLQGKKQESSRGHLKSTAIYSIEEANDRLYDIFENHSCQFVSHEQRRNLAHYYTLLMAEQNKQNFTRILNFRDIAIKQFIDCIYPSQLTNFVFPMLDIGSGPGLPGIPLKIMHPDKEMFLAEGVGKRVTFLKDVREKLELQKLGIFGRNIAPNFVYPVQSIITRAVEDIGNTFENTKHCLQTGGKAYFLKGPNVDKELELIPKEYWEYFELTEDISYDLPSTQHKRRLLVFTKIKASPLVSMERFIEDDD